MAGIKQLFNNVKSLFSEEEKPDVRASYRSGENGTSTTIFALPFDGEKNLGEIGPIKKYILQYDLLRLRSWQSYLESEITQTVINKYVNWVIGSGLKIQAEPSKLILQQDGINVDFSDFSKNVEARFNLFSKSRQSDFSKMKSLNKLSNVAFLNAKVGGDVLVIIRYIKGVVNVQLVDGQHLRKDSFGDDYTPDKLPNGNTVRNGIELAPNGEHVAYYVTEHVGKNPVRVQAKNKRGIVQAFLYYGFEYRMDNHRGIPLISAVLETLKKMERYKEATVGSAEERQKIAYAIEHGIGSTGENPLNRNMAKAFDADSNQDLPTDINGTELANTIAATTNKQTYNLPNDSKLVQLASTNELNFKDFYNVNIDLVCACLGIPPDVAMSKYENSFSASRAALKDWEHTLLVERNSFKEGFMQHIYDYWFEIMVHENKISAPGYLTANSNSDTREAYKNCRFIGANVPHIDPLKEVKAEREKLGEAGRYVPLTTPELATESLNSGDYDQNVSNFDKAIKDLNSLDIKENNVKQIEKT